MWRSTNKRVEQSSGTISSGWNVYPIENPNVDMKSFTNTDPDFPNYEMRNAPKLNVDKASTEVDKLRNPFKTFAPVRASEERGRYSLSKEFLIMKFEIFVY